jgi:hypothetical protein
LRTGGTYGPTMSCGTPRRTSPLKSGAVISPKLVVEGQETPRADEKPFAARGQTQPATVALQQLSAERVLEPLHLRSVGFRRTTAKQPAGGTPGRLSRHTLQLCSWTTSCDGKCQVLKIWEK